MIVNSIIIILSGPKNKQWRGFYFLSHKRNKLEKNIKFNKNKKIIKNINN